MRKGNTKTVYKQQTRNRGSLASFKTQNIELTNLTTAATTTTATASTATAAAATAPIARGMFNYLLL